MDTSRNLYFAKRWLLKTWLKVAIKSKIPSYLQKLYSDYLKNDWIDIVIKHRLAKNVAKTIDLRKQNPLKTIGLREKNLLKPLDKEKRIYLKPLAL